jgi:uncharacterized RDD family membrane protein YckC
VDYSLTSTLWIVALHPLREGSDQAAAIAVSVYVILTALYHCVLVARTGRTLGKLIAGTRVEFAPGSNVGQSALIRWVVQFIVWTTVSGTPNWVQLLAGVSLYGGVVVRSDRRGLHDLAARTRVVRSSARSRPLATDASADVDEDALDRLWGTDDLSPGEP